MVTSLKCTHGKVRSWVIELLQLLRNSRNWEECYMSWDQPSTDTTGSHTWAVFMTRKQDNFLGLLQLSMLEWYLCFYLAMRLFLPGQPHQFILTFGQFQTHAKTPQVRNGKVATGIYWMYSWNRKLVLLNHPEIVPGVLQLSLCYIFRICSYCFSRLLHLIEGI